MARMKLKIEGREYSVDDLTLNELETLEEAIGVPFDQMEFGSAKVLKHFAHLLISKTNPDFTLEDAGKLPISALMEEEAEEEDAGPPVSSEALNGSSGTAAESVGTSEETSDPAHVAAGLR
jgi:hypothetical protein